MLLSGIWDRFPKLNVLIAHSGGTLPFLAGRIESCIAHDAHLKREGKLGSRRDLWDVLRKNIYLDAVIYADVGLKAATGASGADRLMFGKAWVADIRPGTTDVPRIGTDHPFFPPLEKDQIEWQSVTQNSRAVMSAFGDDEKAAEAVMGENAMRVLRLG